MYGTNQNQPNGNNYSMTYPFSTFLASEKRQQPQPFIQGINGGMYPSHFMGYHSLPLNQFSYGMDPNQAYLFQGNHYNQFIPQQKNTTFSKSVFQNPLHPLHEYYANKQEWVQQPNQTLLNQYPKGAFNVKPTSGVKSVLNSFKSTDGTIDINKMVNTAGQMMNAVNQVSAAVKGFSGMFKA